MENRESNYVRILKEICSEEGIDIKGFSGDWAFELSKDGKKGFIVGYQFGLNKASAMQVCNDKNIASEVLKEAGIPSVYHACFMAPSMQQWVGSKGNWKILSDMLEKYNKLVCKDNYGTGGNQVFLAEDNSDLEKAADAVFSKSEAMAVCPFEDIQEECRLVILDNEIRLAFSKIRPSVTGDGSSTLGMLIGKLAAEGRAGGYTIPENTGIIPAKGETVLLNWKHNLGQGAQAQVHEISQLDEQLKETALKAAAAVGIRFASVDMIKTVQGWKVLEINAGVMMEHFAGTSSEDYIIAKAIYRDAVQKMFSDEQ